ncbi:U-box domain-containing protein 28-like [Pyrus ussuriensis x Pyrus communis]|uniref:U-box domain-containing protein n=1 Tax=Pyrus ussuriensis x Pyrus communis TaxID=2448454 RepID=A0A5N5FGE6_9ROSA|nr:U-box domain-containing protein 28-like [Pyrus ussuriensis x Pyrus communis]
MLEWCRLGTRPIFLGGYRCHRGGLGKTIDFDEDSTDIKVNLSCLIALSTPKKVKVRFIRLGAVKLLSKLLQDPNSTTAEVEEALKVLEMVSSVKEGRGKICKDGKCVTGIVQRLRKVSSTATKHAMTILWNVFCLIKEKAAQDEVGRAGKIDFP